MTPYLIIGLLGISLILNYFVGKKHLNLYKNSKGSIYSGEQIVAHILDDHEVTDVTIQQSHKLHTNYYHPLNETIHLGPDVYNQKTSYSVAIGAHEAMHAIDYNVFRLLKIHTSKINKFVFLPLLGASFFFEHSWFHYTILGLYTTMVLFKFFTETFDELKMNRKAFQYLKTICTDEELREIKHVYRVNNWTYITNTPFIFY